MKLQEIQDLVKLIDRTGITELTLENNGMKMVIKKNILKEKTSAREDLQNITPVVSLIVGTFYRGPAPDAPPFVRKGDIVSKGQTLCIIEAMKLMNEIKAEVEGQIAEILVENGETVEYGQPLFHIKALP